MLDVYYSPAHLFCSFHFSFPALCQLWRFPTESGHLAISSSCCGYCYGCYAKSLGFYFQGSELPLSFSRTWSDSMHKAYTALQEQVVALMLCRMAFYCLTRWLPCLWTIRLLKCIYVIKVYSFSFMTILPHTESRQQACYYSMSSMHSFKSHCGSWLPMRGKVSSRMVSSLHTKVVFQLWGEPEVVFLPSSCSNQCQCQYNLRECLTSGNLEVEHFQPVLDISGELHISSSCITFPSSVYVAGRTCHRSIRTYNSNCTLLNGSFLVSHSLNILKDIPYCILPYKILSGMLYKLTCWSVYHSCI